MEIDDVTCAPKCLGFGFFKTLDKKCIRCGTLVEGCLQCTDDYTCDRRLPGMKGCQYKTTCLSCDDRNGFKLDTKGNCCQVKNCNVCDPFDNKRCLSCSGGFSLLKLKYIEDSFDEMDQCITIIDCNKARKIKNTGFYSHKNIMDPFYQFDGIIQYYEDINHMELKVFDENKNLKINTFYTQTQGEELPLKIINDSGSVQHAYRIDAFGEMSEDWYIEIDENYIIKTFLDYTWIFETDQPAVSSNYMKIGQLGGICECPNGEIFKVGAIDNDCEKIACFGGVTKGCNLSKELSGELINLENPLINPKLYFEYSDVLPVDYVEDIVEITYKNYDNIMLNYCVLNELYECYEKNEELMSVDPTYQINFDLQPGESLAIKTPLNLNWKISVKLIRPIAFYRPYRLIEENEKIDIITDTNHYTYIKHGEYSFKKVLCNPVAFVYAPLMNIFGFQKETIVTIKVNKDFILSNVNSPTLDSETCKTCADSCFECINDEECVQPMKVIESASDKTPFFLTSGKVCWISNCLTCRDSNMLINYSSDVGIGGADCICPDGETYQVGVYNHDKSKVACVNGQASKEIFTEIGPWSYKKVLCATLSYEGFEYDDQNLIHYEKYANEICKTCRENFCFHPSNSISKITKREKRNTICESTIYFSSEDLMEEDFYKAESDSFDEYDLRVKDTPKGVKEPESLYCQCEYSGKIYQVGKWEKNYDQVYDMTQPAEIRATLEDLKEQEDILYYRDEKFVIKDYEIACVNGMPVTDIPANYVPGGPNASVICHKPHYCYKCPWPCKQCLNATVRGCVSCILDHNLVLNQPNDPTGKCERPKPLPVPEMVWSNVKYRVQFQFAEPIKEKDFAEHVTMVQIGGTYQRNRRRLLSNKNDAPERIIQEVEDIRVKIKTAELSESKKYLNLYFANSENRESSLIKFEVDEYNIFQAEDDPNTYLQDLYFEIDDVSIYQSGMEQQIEELVLKVASLLRAIMLVCQILVPPVGIEIIKLFQMLDYYQYFNIEPPTNLRLFQTLFEETPFDYCPNPFQDLKDSTYGCTPHKKFEENEVTCYILNNFGGYILQQLVFGLVKLTAVIMIKTLENEWKESNIFRKLVYATNESLNTQFIAGFIDGTQLDIYMSIFINIVMLNEKNQYLMINFGMSQFSFVFYMWLCVTSGYISNRIQSVENPEENKGYLSTYEAWMFMRDGLKINSVFARHNTAIMYFKDPILAAFLVFGHNNPSVQIGGITCVNFTIFMLFMVYKPFEEFQDNLLEIVNNFLFTITCLGFLGLGMAKQQGINEETKFTYIGWVVCGILTFQLVFNFIFVLQALFFSIRDIVMTIKEKLVEIKNKGFDAEDSTAEVNQDNSNEQQGNTPLSLRNAKTERLGSKKNTARKHAKTKPITLTERSPKGDSPANRKGSDSPVTLRTNKKTDGPDSWEKMMVNKNKLKTDDKDQNAEDIDPKSEKDLHTFKYYVDNALKSSTNKLKKHNKKKKVKKIRHKENKDQVEMKSQLHISEVDHEISKFVIAKDNLDTSNHIEFKEINGYEFNQNVTITKVVNIDNKLYAQASYNIGQQENGDSKIECSADKHGDSVLYVSHSDLAVGDQKMELINESDNLAVRSKFANNYLDNTFLDEENWRLESNNKFETDSLIEFGYDMNSSEEDVRDSKIKEERKNTALLAKKYLIELQKNPFMNFEAINKDIELLNEITEKFDNNEKIPSFNKTILQSIGCDQYMKSHAIEKSKVASFKKDSMVDIIMNQNRNDDLEIQKNLNERNQISTKQIKMRSKSLNKSSKEKKLKRSKTNDKMANSRNSIYDFGESQNMSYDYGVARDKISFVYNPLKASKENVPKNDNEQSVSVIKLNKDMTNSTIVLDKSKHPNKIKKSNVVTKNKYNQLASDVGTDEIQFFKKRPEQLPTDILEENEGKPTLSKSLKPRRSFKKSHDSKKVSKSLIKSETQKFDLPETTKAQQLNLLSTEPKQKSILKNKDRQQSVKKEKEPEKEIITIQDYTTPDNKLTADEQLEILQNRSRSVQNLALSKNVKSPTRRPTLKISKNSRKKTIENINNDQDQGTQEIEPIKAKKKSKTPIEVETPTLKRKSSLKKSKTLNEIETPALKRKSSLKNSKAPSETETPALKRKGSLEKSNVLENTGLFMPRNNLGNRLKSLDNAKKPTLYEGNYKKIEVNKNITTENPTHKGILKSRDRGKNRLQMVGLEVVNTKADDIDRLMQPVKERPFKEEVKEPKYDYLFEKIQFNKFEDKETEGFISDAIQAEMNHKADEEARRKAELAARVRYIPITENRPGTPLVDEKIKHLQEDDYWDFTKLSKNDNKKSKRPSKSTRRSKTSDLMVHKRDPKDQRIKDFIENEHSTGDFKFLFNK